MATYPIKMLKDENNNPFVPLVSTECVRDSDNHTLQQILNTKLGPANLLPGQYVNITTQGDNCYIAVDLPSALTLVDNLNATTANTGALDAHQGYILKNMIPTVVDDVTDTSTTKALSANQGYLLNQKFGDYVTTSNLTSTLSGYSTTSHSHGLLNSDFTVALPNSTTDSGWSLINSTYNGFLLKSIRGDNLSPNWFSENYAAGIAFGGADTKGVISLSYASSEKTTKFAGGNGTGPTWWYGITGDSSTVYDLNIPIGFDRRDMTATWGQSAGALITDWSDGSGGDIMFRKNCPSAGQLSVVIDGRFYQNEGRYRVLDTSDLGNYGFYKWSGSVVLDSTTTSVSKELSITTHGRPVYIIVTGDNNPTSETCWFNIFFYRNGTLLSSQTVESHGASWNIPFAMQYLDTVAAGTYTYKVEFVIGTGSTQLNESGNKQSPNFTIFEI